MSSKTTDEKLDKVIKKLDIIIVILLAKSGLTRKEIADALGVSEKTIGRLIPVSKIRGAKMMKMEIEPQPQSETDHEAGENEQGKQ